MDRRQYLCALAGASAGLAGCASGTFSSFPSDPTVQRHVHLVDVQSIDQPHDFRLDVELVSSVVTDTETAQLRTTLTNTGETRRIGAARALFAEGGSTSKYTFGLMLMTPSRMADIERVPGRWTRDAHPDAERGFGAGVDVPPTLDEGESVSHDYYVWDDYRYEGYMRPDTYPFEVDVGLGTDDGEHRSTTWGFSLNVVDPSDGDDSP
jgi:hypothetical protein